MVTVPIIHSEVPTTLFVPIGLGELFDRHSIITLKERNAKNQEIRDAMAKCLGEIKDPYKISKSKTVVYLGDILANVNEALWNIEDSVRETREDSSREKEFLDAAKAVPVLNDLRAHLKKLIDKEAGCATREMKIYKETKSFPLSDIV